MLVNIKKNLRWDILLILLFQISLIILLITNINQKKGKTLGIHVEPINKEEVVVNSPSSSSLIYFYEPKANSKIIDNSNWLPNEVVYTINSDSLNDRFNYPIEKSPDTYRVITLGDSNTFGLYVNTEDNYPEKMEDLLNSQCVNTNKFEVINLGMDGYDINYVVERYKRRGVKYNPDLVIWFITLWDYTKINEVIMPKAMEAFTSASKSGELKNYYYKYYLWLEQEKFRKDQIQNLTRLQYKYFSEFRKTYHGKLLLMVFSDQLAGGTDENNFGTFIDKIKDTDKYIYILSDVTYKDLETLKYDPHPNVKDHLLISETITNYLTEKNLAPCQ
jgi:uncharacterized protein (UPF0333 family)